MLNSCERKEILIGKNEGGTVCSRFSPTPAYLIGN